MYFFGFGRCKKLLELYLNPFLAAGGASDHGRSIARTHGTGRPLNRGGSRHHSTLRESRIFVPELCFVFGRNKYFVFIDFRIFRTLLCSEPAAPLPRPQVRWNGISFIGI
jgi:hypothetical protein